MRRPLDPAAVVPLIVADVFELAGAFRAQGETIAAAAGQTQARWQVLSAASAESCTVPQVARQLGVTRQNVQRIADLLVQGGWARYQPNPDHRNSPHLVLNTQGREVLERLTRTAEHYHADIAAGLGTADLTAVHRGLRQLIAAVDGIAIAGDRSRRTRRRRKNPEPNEGA